MKDQVKKKNSTPKTFVGALTAAIVVMLIVGLSTSRFWDFNNLNNLFLAVSITALIAIGGTLVIITGGIDISSGSLIAMITMVLATLAVTWGWPIWISMIIAIIISALMGAFNGVFTAYLRVPAFISTLAGMSIFKGVAFLINTSPIFSLAPNYEFLFYGKLFDIIPLPLVYIAFFYILFAFIMKYTKLGREIYAVGGNESAARLSGINVKKVKFITYIIAGLMTGFASVLMTSRLNSGSPNYGLGMEMSAIAAVVIGGTSLSGGKGNIYNTLIGALTIVIVQNGLNLNAVPTSLQGITLGVIILIAVLIDMWKAELGEIFKRIFKKTA